MLLVVLGVCCCCSWRCAKVVQRYGSWLPKIFVIFIV